MQSRPDCQHTATAAAADCCTRLTKMLDTEKDACDFSDLPIGKDLLTQNILFWSNMMYKVVK